LIFVLIIFIFLKRYLPQTTKPELHGYAPLPSAVSSNPQIYPKSSLRIYEGIAGCFGLLIKYLSPGSEISCLSHSGFVKGKCKRCNPPE
jgi:hypothetical protein